jgi:hypothetical protein
MSANCSTTKHPLLRDGTSQIGRLLNALLPSYVSVDERSFDDLLAFAKRYAEEIYYYDQTNTKNSHWVEFFNHQLDETGSTTQPHYALFVAFLDLFRVAQDDLNTITARHLDFYYREVLQLQEKPAVPDQAYIIFDLAKNTFTSLIAKDTLLNGGKDGLGKNLDYSVDKNIVVNKAAVKSLKAVYADEQNDYRIYTSPTADSADGQGAAFEGEPRWRTFGRIGTNNIRPQADFGFAISSPILRMAEGIRTITLRLNFSQNLGVLPSLTNAFRVSFSGNKEWINGEENSSGSVQVGTNSITIIRTLQPGQAAIIDYNDSLLGTQFDSEWPVMKVLFNTDTTQAFLYRQLKDKVITSAELKVNAAGVKNLTLFSDQGKLKADKPFEPFGSRPVIGSTFYIGSAEVFSKRLSNLFIDIEWQGLPTSLRSGFSGYYDGYLGDNVDRRNTGFTTNISILDGRVWQPSLGNYGLFNVARPTNNSNPPPDNRPLSTTRRISITTNTLSTVKRDPELETVTVADANTFKGFIRLDLAGADFGHKDYAASVTTNIINRNPRVVNIPYTPTIKSMSLTYESSTTIDFSATTQEAFDARIDRYLLVQPYGYNELHPFLNRQAELNYFVPQFNDEGNLYIGLQGLKPSQVVNILFKVAEGSADPDLEKQPVNWSYLSNKWLNSFGNYFLRHSIGSKRYQYLFTIGLSLVTS